MKKTIHLFTCIFIWFFFTGIAMAFQPFPDTGQTMCYDANHQEVSCDSIQPGDPYYGQDGHYQPRLPRSYTKLGHGGAVLADGALHVDDGGPWIMTRDNVTGLIWEVKTNANRNNEYHWFQAQDRFIYQLNSQNFGGFSDWRLPEVKELSSIINRGIRNPAIDMTWFYKTGGGCYWSSSATQDWRSKWYITFQSGDHSYASVDTGKKCRVRAVRGKNDFSVANFLDNGNGTVTDMITGLVWQKETAPGTYTWQQALDYAKNLTLAGYSDWRLPNINELQTLVNSPSEPAIYPVFRWNTVSSSYWSSTTYNLYTYAAWRVHFLSGSVGSIYAYKINDYHVRCVRGKKSDVGQLGSLVVHIEPKAAVNAGAQWRRTGTTTWRNSGYLESNIPVGSHTIEFKEVSGWTKPVNKSVNIQSGQTANVAGRYGTLPVSDALEVMNWIPETKKFINPSEQFTIGAKIKYELETKDSAILELAIYRGKNDGTIGRWSWEQITVEKGTNSVDLFCTFGVDPEDDYIKAAAILRVDDNKVLTIPQWSESFPIIKRDAANPKDLFTWKSQWREFNTEYVYIFSLLGNTYSYTTASVIEKDVIYIIPLVARFNNSGLLERINQVTEKSEYIAVMQYALMRFGQFDIWGYLGVKKVWDERAKFMEKAAHESDPNNANTGIYLISAGKSLFMIGAGMLTGGTGVITHISHVLHFGQFMIDLYNNVLLDPDMGNDMHYATKATNMASPSSFSDEEIFKKELMLEYVTKGVSNANNIVEVGSHTMELLSFVCESTYLDENAFLTPINVLVDNKNLYVKHHFHGIKHLRHPHRIAHASATVFAGFAISYALEKLTEIGPYTRNTLANLQYHYNALSLLATSIANDIERIKSINDPDLMQEHLAILKLKIDLWYKCLYETYYMLTARLSAVNDSGWYGWMVKNKELEKIKEQSEHWKWQTDNLVSTIDGIGMAIDHMLGYPLKALPGVMMLLLDE